MGIYIRMGMDMGLHREINDHCVARVSESAVHTRKAMSALQQCVMQPTYVDKFLYNLHIHKHILM